jgi:hypothetical protein
VGYTISLGTWAAGTPLYIAAHAVVRIGGVNGIGATLPDQVDMVITFPGLGFGAPSYFDITVSGGTTLDGTYDGYCVDIDSGYFTPSVADVYSSYEPLPSGLIEKPENLDLVNWIINQDFVGQPSSCDGVYTWGDMQWVIWQLIEDNPPAEHSSLGDWSLCRAQEILAAAFANGEGFVAGCGEVMGVVLVPDFGPYRPHQPVLIWVDVPCAQEETAWSGELAFSEKNWATYFQYTLQ